MLSLGQLSSFPVLAPQWALRVSPSLVTQHRERPKEALEQTGVYLSSLQGEGYLGVGSL